MLVLTRKEGESILIELSNDINPEMTVSKLFENGPIEIQYVKQGDKKIKLGLIAPDELTILRSELTEY